MSYLNDKRKELLNGSVDIVKAAWDSAKSLVKFFTESSFDLLEERVKVLFRDVLAPVFKPAFKLIGIEDETIISVEVVTTPLLSTEAKYFNDLILNSIRQNQSTTEQIRFGLLTSQRATLRRVLQYGKNDYIDGIPEVTLSEYFSDQEVVQDTIETEVGETITISSIEFNEPNIDLWCKYYLIANNSYVLETNTLVWYYSSWQYDSAVINGSEDAFIVTLSRAVTTTVIVDDYTQVLIDGIEYTDTWTRTTTNIDTGTPSEFITSYVDTNYVRTPTSTGGPYTTTFINISTTVTPSTQYDTYDTEVPIYNEGGYYGVVYALDSSPTVSDIWFYSSITGVYPELDNSLIAGDTDNLDNLPIIALREEFVNVDSDKTSEKYLTTKRILDLLNLAPLDGLLDSLNSNEDIDLIQDAFLSFGVNLYTTDPYSLRYLFTFFYSLSSLPKFDKTAFQALSPLDQSNSNFIYKVTEGRYNVTLTGNYIEITEIVGYIGELGHIESEFTILPNTEATIEDLDTRSDLTQQNSTDSLGLVNSIFYIRAQTTETVYTEIEISGLVLTTYIVTLGTQVAIKAIEMVDPTTGDSADKANFIIPLSFYYLQQIPPLYTEQIIYDSVHLTVYAEQLTDLAYYETSAFLDLISVIIQIVSIIILVVTLGGASTATKALWDLANHLMIQYGLAKALEGILSSGLSDVEKVVAGALLIFASIQSGQGLSTASELLLADKILLAINAVSNIITIDTQAKVASLTEDQKELESLITEKEEELQAAQEYLTFDTTIDTFNLLNSSTVPLLDTTSTPAEFYQRSLLVNVAPIILSQPSTYVSTVLDLNNVTPVYERSVDYDIRNEIQLI